MHLTASGASSTSLAVPPTQNTAPVLEFNCLYTHDIRRKSKRWQDGFLRFHTFNKRVMVYDVSRNFIGDSHWTDGDVIQDGDEVKLDKNGVLVQVADKIGQTETDLSDLRKSKNKPTTNPASSSPLRLTSAINIVNPTHPERRPLQPKHRSLNALLGSGRSPIGKAVLPSKSPYEIRKENVHGEAEGWAQQGNAKRRRISNALEHDGATIRDVQVNTTAAPTPQSKARLAQDQPNHKTNTGVEPRPTARNKSTKVIEIDLCSDDEPTEIFSSMAGEPVQKTPQKPPQPTERSFTAQRTTENVPAGKRLFIAKATSKRNTLACHSMVSGDIDDELQQAQKERVEARLARLQQRKHSEISETFDNNVFGKGATARIDKSLDKTQGHLGTSRTETTSALPTDVPTDQAPHEVAQTKDQAAEQAHSDAPCEIDADTDAIADEVEHEPCLALAQDDLLALDEMLSSEAEAELADLDAGSEPIRPSTVEHSQEAELKQPANLQEASPGAIQIDVPDQLTEGAGAGAEPCSPPVADQDERDDAPGPAVDTGAEQSIETNDTTQDRPRRTRMSKRVTRTDIRKSASSCFKPPTPAARNKTAAAVQRQAISSTMSAGAWSREAFDLFSWRPPGWDEDSWSLKT